ncbi:cation transport protein-domain-containing protein [Sparassis latifolia]
MLAYIKSRLNFFRIHLLSFLIIPLLFAVIFWASNGEYKIKFIDALFVCYSGVTGTGLTTIDLSSLTIWQQTILVILELIGNQAFVAWVVVFVRRLYFLNSLEHIPTWQSTGEHPPSLRLGAVEEQHRPDSENAREGDTQWKNKSGTPLKKFHPGMVRRVDIAPHLITPTGVRSMQSKPAAEDDTHATRHVVQASGVDQLSRVTSRRSTIIRVPPPDNASKGDFGGFPGVYDLISRLFRRMFPRLHSKLRRTMTLPRTETLVPHRGDNFVDSAGPQVAKRVPYISFRAIVGRNSAFRGLSRENIEELGGVEYRALTSLLWIVPLYYFGLLAISFVVVAPTMVQSRWRSNFEPPQQHKKINPVWFSAFQVVGAWANTGMSLVDQNMVPFRTAYPMIVFLVFCVLAGNTLFILCNRHLSSWILAKLYPNNSRTKESMQFLLDHPRRCFIYLFPSHQTWLLFGITMLLNVIDFMFDPILNIDNPFTDVIPVGTRIFDAILQAVAVRSSGYQSVALSSLVPAVQVLYVIMMYIAIYPIAMSVRSTNVYEENSLGIYEEDDDESDYEALLTSTAESRVSIWGKYLLRHARRQLAFDMWWLALSVFLICIIERPGLTNTANATWFNVFACIFEVVSAYGTVGLSLGIPTANYSLSGAFHTLSKLVMCAVMIRGRHRGLPVALDRAVLLPHEFRPRTQPGVGEKNEETPRVVEEPESSSHSSQEGQDPPESVGMRERTRTLSFAGDQGIQVTRTGDMRPYIVKEELEYSGSAV